MHEHRPDEFDPIDDDDDTDAGYRDTLEQEAYEKAQLSPDDDSDDGDLDDDGDAAA